MALPDRLQWASPDPYSRLAELMGALETALRGAGYWEPRPPSPRALESIQPFCIDTLPFTTWLQWVFIPRVHRLINRREALPPHSDILPYAEECLRDASPGSHRILGLVERFDRLINEAARRHATHH